MDRIRDLRPLGSPHAVYKHVPQVLERLLSRTTPGPNGCVIWTGYRDRDNYGDFKFGGKHLRAHRAIYQLLAGSLDASTLVDHTCHNTDKACQGGRSCLHRRCVNPHHLEAVTNRENLRRSPNSNARKTHCSKGHPFDGVNSYSTGVRRICRTCAKANSAASRERKRAAAGGAQ